VAESLHNLIVAQQENAGHALHVSGWKAREVARKPSRQHAENAFRIQVLAPVGAHKAKRLIKTPFDVTKSRLVRQAVGCKETLSLFLVG
jgi:hypothetical protein